MDISDLRPDDAAAIEQAAQALVDGFREHWPTAWPDLIVARAEVEQALEPGKVCRVARGADGRVLGWSCRLCRFQSLPNDYFMPAQAKSLGEPGHPICWNRIKTAA